MAHSALEYIKMLQALLPKGKLWTRSTDSILYQVLYGMSEEFVRVEGRSEDLIEEARVETTDELITEFEEEFGLPEFGQDLAESLADRRESVLSKLIALGQQDKPYFEEIAESLGYDISIYEPTPCWAGIGGAGDPCGDQDLLFYWIVYFLVDNSSGEYRYNITEASKRINFYKPGHTIALYDFYNPAFSRAFGNGFDAIQAYEDNSWTQKAFSRDFDSSFTNAYDYDGVYLTGAFNKGFSIAFDRNSGGAFNFDNFGNGFHKPG